MAISYRAAQTLIKRGDEAGLRTALEGGLDPKSVNQNGWSLFMLAAVEGAVPLAQLLLEHGADANASNRNGETALSLAAGKGHLPFVEFLLGKGASKNCKPHGSTLSTWLTTASGLTPPQLAEMLQALGI